MSNPQEEINIDNNKQNNFPEEYLQQNQTETKNTISEVSTIEPSEEIIQSNTGMNESRVSNLNDRIIDDEGNKNGAASNEELTVVKSNTASNDDAQKTQNDLSLENRDDNSISENSAIETEANEQKSLTNNQSINNSSNEANLEREIKSETNNLALTDLGAKTLSQEQEANTSIIQDGQDRIEINNREGHRRNKGQYIG